MVLEKRRRWKKKKKWQLTIGKETRVENVYILQLLCLLAYLEDIRVDKFI
jgi:hypothetical protein